MSVGTLYAVTGAVLFVLGLAGMLLQPHLLRKIMAFNVMGGGTFLVLVGLAQRHPEAVRSDPVPQAMVLTGIVVAVSATAFAVVLVRRLYAVTGATALEDDLQDRE